MGRRALPELPADMQPAATIRPRMARTRRMNLGGRSDQPGIARYRLDHRVHLTAEHRLREAEREALHGMEGHMRRSREREGIDDRVDDDRPAAVGEGLCETRLDIARLLDADALRTHRLRHLGEVRV